MHDEQNQRIDIAPSDRIYPDFQHIKHLDPTHSIDIIVLITLLTGIQKLWKAIDAMRKRGKCSPQLLLQAVGAIGAIVKAISQWMDDE